MARINFGDTVPTVTPPKNNFPIIQPGDYAATITGATDAPSKTSGNPQITLTVRFTEPPYMGRVMSTWYQYTLDYGRENLRALLFSLGFPAEAISGETEFDPITIVGEEVVVTVYHDKKNPDFLEKIRTVIGVRSYQSPTERIAAAAGAPRSDTELPF